MRNWVRGLVGAVLLVVMQSNPLASQARPSALDVVRRFCQADGLGLRLDPRRWALVAPLVNWPLEPAWDRVFIVSGYQIQTPRHLAEHVEVPIEYTVTATVAAGEVDTAVSGPQIVSVALHVEVDATGTWRIIGPPPVPYVFATQFDPAAVRASLQPDSTTYLSNSAFVWRMLAQAGWSIPYRSVHELRDPSLFAPVTEPTTNDVALFVGDDGPYHVGLVTADNLIASATINRGITQTTPDAFPGAVIYLHLLQSPAETPTPPAVTDAGLDQSELAPAPTPVATGTPTVAKPAKKPAHAPRPRKKRPRPQPTPKSRRRPAPHATPTHGAR
ncbi:MAG TPA: hypothetical protein VL403_11455 [Candidatus Kryptonia bacterium]|nr:hypothetical protein [Candidatus Kryptonia bacterium]